MEVTAKKLEANRQNAQKSTGPATPEGKAKVAANGIKRGLLARSAVVENPVAAESPEEFDALLAAFRADLQPDGPMEEALVERITTCHWRLARAQRFEAYALDAAPDPDAIPYEVTILHDQLQELQERLDHFQDLTALYAKPDESRIDEENERIAQWEVHWGGNDDGESTDEPDDAEEDDDDNKDGDADADDADDDAVDFSDMEMTPQKKLSYDKECLEEEIAEVSGNLRQAQADAAANRTRSALSALIPPPGDLLSMVRFESMLDRQLHRALLDLGRLRSQRIPRPGPRRHLNQPPQSPSEELMEEQPVS